MIVCQSLSEIMLRNIHVFWACSGIRCQDTFQFFCDFLDTEAHVSKRVKIFEVVRLFDPLGLLSESDHCDCKTHLARFVAIVHPMGRVRSSGHPHSLDWFQNTDEWFELRIPRCVKLNALQSIVEVHGFCDVSQCAFGACIYLRTKLGLNDNYSKLLCSKSRVAPFKTVSLPRLELSAALLMARLINKETSWNSRNAWLIYDRTQRLC